MSSDDEVTALDDGGERGGGGSRPRGHKRQRGAEECLMRAQIRLAQAREAEARARADIFTVQSTLLLFSVPSNVAEMDPVAREFFRLRRQLGVLQMRKLLRAPIVPAELSADLPDSPPLSPTHRPSSRADNSI